MANTENNEALANMPALSEERIKAVRDEVRKNFNESMSKWAVIEDELADDDYINLAKEEFKNRLEKSQTDRYVVVKSNGTDLALRAAKFIKEWNRKYNRWEGEQFKGIIQFDRVIDKTIAELEADNTKDLTFDYSSVIFIYNSMIRPSGVGIESALEHCRIENLNPENFEKLDEENTITYDSFLSLVQQIIEQLRNEDKVLKILRERINFAYSGLRMTIKCETMEEWLEFHEAIIVHNNEAQQELEKKPTTKKKKSSKK